MFQHMLHCGSVGALTCWWLVLVTGKNTSLGGMMGSELSSPPTAFPLVFILATTRSPSLRLGVSKRLLSILVGMTFSRDPVSQMPQRCGVPSWTAFTVLHIPLLPVSRAMTSFTSHCCLYPMRQCLNWLINGEGEASLCDIRASRSLRSVQIATW